MENLRKQQSEQNKRNVTYYCITTPLQKGENTVPKPELHTCIAYIWNDDRNFQINTNCLRYEISAKDQTFQRKKRTIRNEFEIKHLFIFLTNTQQNLSLIHI